jgi:hypothetical protein
MAESGAAHVSVPRLRGWREQSRVWPSAAASFGWPSRMQKPSSSRWRFKRAHRAEGPRRVFWGPEGCLHREPWARKGTEGMIEG